MSVFAGITIVMYWDDHPPPHFHAFHGGREARFEIDTLDLLTGRLPSASLRRVREWGRLHRAELLANWTRGMAHRPFQQIEPLI